jgi:hypothetical protein
MNGFLRITEFGTTRSVYDPFEKRYDIGDRSENISAGLLRQKGDFAVKKPNGATQPIGDPAIAGKTVFERLARGSLDERSLAKFPRDIVHQILRDQIENVLLR